MTGQARIRKVYSEPNANVFFFLQEATLEEVLVRVEAADEPESPVKQ